MRRQGSNETLMPYLRHFFSRYLPSQRGLSLNTIASYKQTWRLFLEFLISSGFAQPDKSPLLTDINVSHILSFLEYLEEGKPGRGNKVSTRNNRLAAIKAFFRAVQLIEPEHKKLCEHALAVPSKKNGKPVVDYLDKGELDAVFSAIDTTTTQGFRDMTIIRFLYNTGARISEVSNLRRQDMDLNHEKQVRIMGKGGRERICPLWDSTVAFVSIYLKSERKRPKQGYEDYLFINQRQEPFTRFGLWRMVIKYVNKAKRKAPTLVRKRISAHTFRHTTAVHLLQSGVDINVISDWLGHVDISTTSHYLHVDMTMKRNALKKFKWLEKVIKTDSEIEVIDWNDRKQVLKWLDRL